MDLPVNPPVKPMLAKLNRDLPVADGSAPDRIARPPVGRDRQ